MLTNPQVVSVNISEEKGTIKHPVPKIELDNSGIVGDAHSGQWHRQVSLLAQEDIDVFSREAQRQIAPGEFAENITTVGVALDKAAVLDRFGIGEAELQVTQIGKQCHGDECAIYREIGKCVMPHKGIFCRVIKTGQIKRGDTIEFYPKPLKILVITLSDRAFAGIYTDRSGPLAKEMLQEYFSSRRWHLQLDGKLLPDDPVQLGTQLQKAISAKTDVIFTLGGTGLGPRDIAPETVISVSEKNIPGIMENIRIKYGGKKPSALLSRSVAAIADKTQIYALPGSVKAAEEYISEILKTLEHIIYMIEEIDAH